MTELLTWRDDWLLDIDLLDDEHRLMVRLINRLANPDEPTPLIQRLDDLIAHLRGHFQVEQAFLREIRYPDMDGHSREHAMQMAEFVDMRRELARTPAPSQPPTLELSDLRAIKHWFFNHVVAEDRRYAAFYREAVCGA